MNADELEKLRKKSVLLFQLSLSLAIASLTTILFTMIITGFGIIDPYATDILGRIIINIATFLPALLIFFTVFYGLGSLILRLVYVRKKRES